MDSNLGFPNPRNLPYKGSHQIVQQNIGGLNTSPASTYAKRFTYPLWVASTYDAPLAGGLMIDATLRRGKTVEQIGELAFRNAGILAAPLDAAFRGSKVTNLQNGTASYINIPTQKRPHGTGSTKQHYTLSGIRQRPESSVQHDKVLYRRELIAVNGLIVLNKELSAGQEDERVKFSVAQNGGHGNRWHYFAVKGEEHSWEGS
jgi:hypothetical protein